MMDTLSPLPDLDCLALRPDGSDSVTSDGYSAPPTPTPALPVTITAALAPHAAPPSAYARYAPYLVMTARFLGEPPSFYPIMALGPAALATHVGLFARFFGVPAVDMRLPGTLSVAHRRLAFLTASRVFNCTYCTAHACAFGDMMRGSVISQAARSRKGKGPAGAGGQDVGPAAKQAGGKLGAAPPSPPSVGASDGGGGDGSPPYGVVVLDAHDPSATSAEVAILTYVTLAVRRPFPDTERPRLAAAGAAVSDALGVGAFETLRGVVAFAGCLNVVMDTLGVPLEAGSAAFAAAILPRQPSGAPWSAGPHHGGAPRAGGGDTPGRRRRGVRDPSDGGEPPRRRSWLRRRPWGSASASESRERSRRAEAVAKARSLAGGDSFGSSAVFGSGVTGESGGFGRSWARVWPSPPPSSVSATPSATSAVDAEGGDLTWAAAQWANLTGLLTTLPAAAQGMRLEYTLYAGIPTTIAPLYAWMVARLGAPACRFLLRIRNVELQRAFCFALRQNVLVEELSPPPPPTGGDEAPTTAAAAATTTPPRPWTVADRIRLLHVFAVATGSAGLAAGAVGLATRSSGWPAAAAAADLAAFTAGVTDGSGGASAAAARRLVVTAASGMEAVAGAAVVDVTGACSPAEVVDVASLLSFAELWRRLELFFGDRLGGGRPARPPLVAVAPAAVGGRAAAARAAPHPQASGLRAA